MPTAPGAAPGGSAGSSSAKPGSEVITSTNTTMENIEIPGEKRLKTANEGPNAPKPKAVSPGTPVYAVIQTANPISALYEYCKKGNGKHFSHSNLVNPP